MEVTQSQGLKDLCESTQPGSGLEELLAKAEIQKYVTRSGGIVGLDERDWFDREYIRIHKEDKTKGNVAVAIAKPGMGYYVCIIEHKNGLVTKAWFEDQSS